MDILDSLIPLPRRIDTVPGRMRVPATWRINPGSADERVRQACMRWLGAVVWVDAAADLRLSTGPVLGLPEGLGLGRRNEAYDLRIDGTVSITAEGDLGLFRGLATLAQLIELSSRSLPYVAICDWPELSLRNAHLTLGNGFQPPFARLKEWVGELARWKVSSLTIEYDDAFSWERHPYLARPGTLSKDQCRELDEWCRAHFIDVIPLIDSLGHQEHVLHHPKLAHLRELPHSSAEICPSNPASLEFIKGLWSEVLEVHPNSTWANITGDECFRIGGFCPRCDKRAKRGELGRLYGEYYGDLIHWMLDHGRRPMLWHDMLYKHPEELRRFPRETALIYWNYAGIDAPRHPVSLGSHGWIWPDELDTESAPVRALMDPWWRDDHGELFRPWAQLPMLKDAGFEVIAASGGSCMEGPFPHPGFHGRVANPISLAGAVSAYGGLGMVHTFWSDHVSVLAADHSLAAMADHTWHPRTEDSASFLARFGQLQHGMDGDRYAVAAAAFDRACYPAEQPGFPSVERRSRRAPAAARAVAALGRGVRRRSEPVELLAPAVAYLGLLDAVAAVAPAAVLARIPDGADRCLDLTSHANGSLQRITPGDGGSRMRIADGEQSSHGIALRILAGERTMIATRSARNPTGLERIVGISVGGCYDLLCFFHAATYVRAGQEMGAYEVHYVDGVSERVAVIGALGVGDWWNGPEALPDAVSAWEGRLNPLSLMPLRLYLMPWRNPRPQVAIASIDVVSAGTTGHLVVAAITARQASTDQMPRSVGSVAAAKRALAKVRRVLDDATEGRVVAEHRTLAHASLLLPRLADTIDRL